MRQMPRPHAPPTLPPIAPGEICTLLMRRLPRPPLMAFDASIRRARRRRCLRREAAVTMPRAHVTMMPLPMPR